MLVNPFILFFWANANPLNSHTIAVFTRMKLQTSELQDLNVKNANPLYIANFA